MVRCPLCDVPMREVVRRGVQIDVCPECKGVWLDRGELDKLLAAAEGWEAEGGEHHHPGRHHGGDWHRGPGHHDDYYYRRKKKGFLGEIFDIFD